MVQPDLRFDVWCECAPASRADVADFLSRLKLQPPLLAPDGKKTIDGRMQLVFIARPWSVVEALRQSPPAWMTRVTAYEEQYGPSKAESLRHCAIHDLFYAGPGDCPICSGLNGAE